MPFGWGISRPPPSRQFSGMSAPVTIVHQRCRSTATERSKAAMRPREVAWRRESTTYEAHVVHQGRANLPTIKAIMDIEFPRKERDYVDLDRVDQSVAPHGQVKIDVEGPTAVQGCSSTRVGLGDVVRRAARRAVRDDPVERRVRRRAPGDRLARGARRGATQRRGDRRRDDVRPDDVAKRVRDRRPAIIGRDRRRRGERASARRT